MCFFDDNNELKMAVEDAILSKVQAGKVFTGYDIFRSLANLYGVPSWQVSSYVRELFNRHSVVFVGYACYPIPVGPLVFFSVKNSSRKVKEYVEKIVEARQKRIEEEEARREAAEESPVGGRTAI